MNINEDIESKKQIEKLNFKDKSKEGSEINQRMRKTHNMTKSLILFIIAFLLTIAITLQIKTINSSVQVALTPQENKLRDLLLKDKDDLAKLEDIELKREESLDRLREDASKNDQRAKKTKEKLNDINKKLGLTELYGPGVIITVSDATIKKDNTTMDYAQLIVHDTDILHIVNVLKNAGAEAVSVNEQRVVANTGISCIGVVIKINEEKIGSPYIIKAIGSQDNLESAINMIGGIKDVLKSYGLNINITREDNINLPKYTGVYKTVFTPAE